MSKNAELRTDPETPGRVNVRMSSSNKQKSANECKAKCTGVVDHSFKLKPSLSGATVSADYVK